MKMMKNVSLKHGHVVQQFSLHLLVIPLLFMMDANMYQFTLRKTWLDISWESLHQLGHLEVMVQEIEKHHNRSEEHTSELQSRGHLVCRLLLEKTNERESTL